MRSQVTRTGALALLLGGGGMFLLFASGHTKFADQSVTLTETEDYFTLAQYYFNHDDDPAGPYDLALARQYYEASIAADPRGNSLHWYQLGRIDFIEGNFYSALYNFDKQIEYFGSVHANVYYMIGLTNGYLARRTGNEIDWRRGAEGFLRYLEFDPTSPWARTDLAWIYFAQGKYNQMIEPLQVGLIQHPDHAWLLNMYGLALLNTDQKEEAAAAFKAAQAAVSELTAADWGRAYPGNDPADWSRGLAEFRGAIEKNLALSVSE